MMQGIAKQSVGFRFGQYRLGVTCIVGEVKHEGRTYRVVDVVTSDGLPYRSIRLYNSHGKFIKQLLVEHEVTMQVAALLGRGSCSVTYGEEVGQVVSNLTAPAQRIDPAGVAKP